MEILCGMVSSRQRLPTLLPSLPFPGEASGARRWDWNIESFLVPVRTASLSAGSNPSITFIGFSFYIHHGLLCVLLAHGFTNCSNSNIRSTASKLVCSFRERKALRMHSTAVAASSCFILFFFFLSIPSSFCTYRVTEHFWTVLNWHPATTLWAEQGQKTN